MKRLAVYSALTPVVFVVIFSLTNMLLSSFVDTEYVMDEVVTKMETANELPEEVKTYLWDDLAPTISPRSITDIKKNGYLNVGYNPRQVPFSYFNANQELVGFDIEMMKKLASELDVKLVFIPYDDVNAVKALNRGQFDIAISGLQMTTKRIQMLNFTNPVLTLHYSIVVKDHRADEFLNRDYLKTAEKITLASVGEYSISSQLIKMYPNVEIQRIESDKEFFDDKSGKWDGLIISLEAGQAWTILYPEYVAIYNRDDIKSFPMSYAVAQDNISLQTFLNSWLTIQESSGHIEKLYGYWILGENAVPKQPRWSIIKDVLHWVDDKDGD